MNVRVAPRLVLALAGLVAFAPVVACGSDDDSGASAHDAGKDSAPSSDLDSGDNGDDDAAAPADSGADASVDATSASDAGTSDTGTSDASTDAAFSDSGDAAKDGGPEASTGDCTPINAVYDLVGPTKTSLNICPNESGVICHFATESGSCQLISQCQEADGGIPTGFFAIPTGTLDATDSLTYSTSYSGFGAGCTLHFDIIDQTATLTCSVSAPLLGPVGSCGYSGRVTDAGL